MQLTLMQSSGEMQTAYTSDKVKLQSSHSIRRKA